MVGFAACTDFYANQSVQESTKTQKCKLLARLLLSNKVKITEQHFYMNKLEAYFQLGTMPTVLEAITFPYGKRKV